MGRFSRGLHELARNIGNQRILVLVAYRDDELKMNATLWKTVLDMNRERLFHLSNKKRWRS